MPVVTIRYTLPADQAEFDAARTGAEARAVLNEIDQDLRSLLKHGSPTPEQATLARRIREMIPPELLD